MLASNTILQNRYRIVRQLGHGGMGTVYEAIDERLDTTVALKECHFTDEQLGKQFKREARLLARLRHPAMTRVIDHFQDTAGQFLVMDFIPGEDLWEMLKRNGGAFPPEKVLEWADQLLDALNYLHNEEPPIIHRDIKPQNLKLSNMGQIILLDFGLAKGFAGQISHVTTSGSIFGYTPNYAPLEQIQGTGTDPRSDLYSLAATLYNLITGRVPPDALSRATAIMSERPDPLLPANEVNEVVAASVSDALHLAMSNNPAKRPASAVEMRSMLRDAYKNLEPVSSVREKAEILPPTIYDLPPTQGSQERGSTVASPIAPSAESAEATARRREAEEAVLRVARERDQRDERERQKREAEDARRKAEIRRQREEAQRKEEKVTRAKIEDKNRGEPKSGQVLGVRAPAKREVPETQVTTSAIITSVTLFVSLFLVTMLKPRFWQSFDGYIGRWTLIILFATGLWRLFTKLRGLFKSHSYQHRLIYSITKGEEEIEKSYSPLSIAAFLIIGCIVSIAAGLLVGEGMHYAWSNIPRYYFDRYPHPDLLFYPPIIVLLVDVIQSVISAFTSSEKTDKSGNRTLMIAAAAVVGVVLIIALSWMLLSGSAPSDDGSKQVSDGQQTTNQTTTGKANQPAPPARTASGGKPFRNRNGIEMIWIPPGSFEMGSNNGEPDEKPAHRVTIGQGFFIGKYEVTQVQWQAVMGSNPSNFKGDDNLPVEQVSWNDAQEFINKQNETNDGYKYRLPTEAEWEYACRAGTTGDYYAQDVDDIGWFFNNSGRKTHRVGTKQPNAFGLYDMSGNVWEWCRDWFHSDYTGAPTDGSAWVSGSEIKYRVLRGGSWNHQASFLRSTIRDSLGLPDERTDIFGFRVVAIVRTQ